MAVDPNIGDYIPQPANDPSATGGTWQDFIKANRPFLAGMGAQLMVGSPGGVLSNIGAGIAKGNESQNLTEEMNYGRGVEERKFQAGQAEGEANRASHEKIATIGADSRMAVAQEKVAGMLERAGLIHGPQGPKEMDLFFKAKNSYMHDEANREILSKLTRQQQEEYASAYAKTTLQQARDATGIRSQGAPLGTEGANLGGPDATSGVGTPGKAAGTQSVGSGQPAASGQGVPTPILDKAFADPTNGPALQKELSTPEGRARRLADPALKDQIKAEIRAKYGDKAPVKEDPRFQESPLYKTLMNNKNPNSDYSTPGTVLP